MKNIHKEDLEKALFLISEALYFVNNVPNKKYRVRDFEDSYELASNLNKFLKEHNINIYSYERI